MKRLNPAEVLRAWEAARRPLETATAAFRVVGSVLFQPIPFFQAVSHNKKNIRRQLACAFLFAVICGYVKLLCDGLNVIWLKSLTASSVPIGDLATQATALEAAFFSSSFIFLRPLVTLAATLFLVCASVKLVLGVDKPLVPAALIVCYKSAADVCALIPFLGGLLASVGSAVLLVIGVRELYRLGAGRAVLAGAVMPVFVLFFLALSLGPSINRAIVALYPETQSQVMRFNDVTAHSYTAAIVKAAEEYGTELGFYPVNLNTLKKYLSSPAAEELRASDEAAGYRFSYNASGDGGFVVTAEPQKLGVTGSLVFYGDESGVVRLNDKDGRILKDVHSVEAVASGESL